MKTNKNYKIYASLIIFAIIMLIGLMYNFKHIEKFVSGFIDENDKEIDIVANESTEQDIASKFIEPDSVVLELGARYGTVSVAINKKLTNPTNQVSVEPDKNVLESLNTNRKNHNCSFHVLYGFISKKTMKMDGDGYGISSVVTETSDIPSYTFEDVEKKYNLKFDTLVVDCEGCFEDFLDENPEIFKQMKMITFEHDMPHRTNYNKIINLLKNNGFTMIYNSNDFHTVWKK